VFVGLEVLEKVRVVERLKEKVWDLLGCEGVHERDVVWLMDRLELGDPESVQEKVSVARAEGGEGVTLPLEVREVV